MVNNLKSKNFKAYYRKLRQKQFDLQAGLDSEWEE